MKIFLLFSTLLTPSYKNSGFTLLFEAFILELYNHMTVAEIAKKYNTTQHRF
ncbi:transposase family protein [Caloramator sp.]|uniref:transposase family protein n=1 Tax=Caloramator sp. TaxID=1871330 RepID=UPI003457DBF1